MYTLAPLQFPAEEQVKKKPQSGLTFDQAGETNDK